MLPGLAVDPQPVLQDAGPSTNRRPVEEENWPFILSSAEHS